MNDNRSEGSGVRVLQVGPTHQRGNASTNVFGGMAVMMGEQQRELAARGCRMETVDTSGPVTNLPVPALWLMALFRGMRVSWQTARRLRRNHAVCSIMRYNHLWDLGIVLWLLSRALRRPLVLRVVGGSLGRVYADGPRLKRWVADRTFMRADIVYIETLDALSMLPPRDNLRHFPNTRQVPESARRDRREVRRLLFLSRLTPDKGYQECLHASQSLPEGCELSIYGAVHTGIDLAEVDEFPRVLYRGVAENAEVPGILHEHDLMLLPSNHVTEGLPGVILEAFQAGIPVIATRIGGIPELVEDEVNGLLIEPGSVSDLERAIERLCDDPALYRNLCEGAKRRGDDFRSDRWYDRFASDLTRIASG